MSLQHEYYSEEEAQEILRQAVARQAQVGGFGHEHLPGSAPGFSSTDLERMAAELGVAPELVRQVQQERMLRVQEETERKEFIRHQRADFREHLAAYVIVNGMLIAMDFFTSHHITWSIWPLFGWGIGLLFAAKEAFITEGEDFEKEFDKWRKKRAKRRAKNGQ